MHHLEDSALADYVRGLADPLREQAISSHLGRCGRCASIAGSLAAVARVSAADAHQEPPDYVVHAARAIFALRQPEHVRFLSRLLPVLTFDSFREPRFAGVRSGQPMTRQMLYEAGAYSIDLRLDHERGSRHVWLIGQIASDDPEHPVDRLSVSLTRNGRVAAEAFTNSDGEFQLEYEPHPQLQLRIDLRPDELIELPLATQSGDSTEEGRR